MNFLMKMLFGKLCFGIDDLSGGGGAPEGQPNDQPAGNSDQPGGDPAAGSPTEFVDFSGVKVPKQDFEKIAREQFKDAFEAKENRDKWQAENTRKAQELAQFQRDAEAYRRLMAEGKSNQQNQDPYQKARAEYIQDMKRDFPDLDDRFLGKQFDWQMKLAGQTAQEMVSPIHEERGKAFEEKFLAAHPKVQKGSQEYIKIAQYIGSGVDAEDAYNLVFPQDRIESAIKQRDAEATRKLQQTRNTSAQGTKPKPKTFKENFEQTWEKMNA